MKVLLIDVNCKNSSTGKIVYDLYTELNDDGHVASICYGRGKVINELNIHKFSFELETYVHAFLTRVTGLTGKYSPFSTRRLLKLIEEFNPDIVHIHELHGYFVNIAPVMNYLKKKDIKTIWTFHCEFMYTGKCGHAYECERWKTECGKCPYREDYPASLFLDFTKKMFQEKKQLFEGFNNLIIVTPSKWLADRVKQSFLKNKEICVINNGIDTEIFRPRDSTHLKEKHKLMNEKVVLAIAPNIMDEKKGGKWVLELAKRMKTENVKFILIGVEDLNQRFENNVIALGRTSNQVELAEYYSMADVFIICSKRENFPTTCLEAISCGTPIVGFDEGGTKETVSKDNSFLVEYGEISEIEKKIRCLFKNEEDANKKNQICKEYKKKSKKTMCKKYLKLYKT